MQEYTLAYTDIDIMDIGELTVKCNLDLLIDLMLSIIAISQKDSCQSVVSCNCTVHAKLNTVLATSRTVIIFFETIG